MKAEEQLKRAERALYAGYLGAGPGGLRGSCDAATSCEGAKRFFRGMGIQVQSRRFVFSPDGKQMLTVGKDNAVKVSGRSQGERAFLPQGTYKPCHQSGLQPRRQTHLCLG